LEPKLPIKHHLHNHGTPAHPKWKELNVSRGTEEIFPGTRKMFPGLKKYFRDIEISAWPLINISGTVK